jgi:hypothetical protein
VRSNEVDEEKRKSRGKTRGESAKAIQVCGAGSSGDDLQTAVTLHLLAGIFHKLTTQAIRSWALGITEEMTPEHDDQRSQAGMGSATSNGTAFGNTGMSSSPKWNACVLHTRFVSPPRGRISTARGVPDRATAPARARALVGVVLRIP